MPMARWVAATSARRISLAVSAGLPAGSPSCVTAVLGRSGVEDLVERTCALAARMAARLADGGATIANDVVLNQVLVGFGDLSTTDEIVAEVQRDGTCWVGATTWHQQRLIRISVSNATTTGHDIDRSADAILAAAARVSAR